MRHLKNVEQLMRAIGDLSMMGKLGYSEITYLPAWYEHSRNIRIFFFLAHDDFLQNMITSLQNKSYRTAGFAPDQLRNLEYIVHRHSINRNDRIVPLNTTVKGRATLAYLTDNYVAVILEQINADPSIAGNMLFEPFMMSMGIEK